MGFKIPTLKQIYENSIDQYSLLTGKPKEQINFQTKAFIRMNSSILYTNFRCLENYLEQKENDG